METIRVFLLHRGPGTVSIIATLRFGGPEAAEEESRGQHQVILHYPHGAPRTTRRRLVALLDRYHPNWRELVILSAIRRV